MSAASLLPELLDIATRMEAMLTRQRWAVGGTDPEAVLLRDVRAALANATPDAEAPLANRDFQLLQLESAGLQSSVGHLGVMVDELRGLTQRAIKAISTLHSAATPDDSTEDIDARIPGPDFATFVNEHAALLHAFAHHADMPAAPAQQAGESGAQKAVNAIAALAPTMLTDWPYAGRYRCQQCRFEWGADLGTEGHAMNCAYAIATSVSHTPPAAQQAGAPLPDAAQLGRDMARWTGMEFTGYRDDTGQPEQRVTVSVERLGYAVEAILKGRLEVAPASAGAPLPLAPSVPMTEALYDSAFIAGAKAGANATHSDDPEALNKLIATRDGYLRVLATLPATESTLSECDSPELCAVNRQCAGQYGTKRICRAQPQADAAGEATQRELNMAIAIRRLVSKARRHCEDGSPVLALANEAWGLLLRLGLQGSPLRDVDAPQADPVDGIELAARFVEKRLLDYDSAHGTTDPETGTREYPGDGDEYVGELQEIADGIRAIAAQAPGAREEKQ